MSNITDNRPEPLKVVPPGLGDTLLGWAMQHDADVEIEESGSGRQGDPRWMVYATAAEEGHASRGSGETIAKAVEALLANVGVNPCAACGWSSACYDKDEECHS